MEICRTGNIITEIKVSIDMFNRMLNSAAKQIHELKDQKKIFRLKRSEAKE